MASGQTTIEYLALLAVLIGFAQLISKTFPSDSLRTTLQNKVIAPLQATYQYGSADATGWDPGGGGTPNNHPRIQTGNNFKLFINPKP